MNEIPSAKSDDQPATRKMLRLVRDELKSEIRAVSHKIDQYDSRFNQQDSKFEQIDAKFKEVDARFDELTHKMDSGFATLIAESFRTRALLEEQAANNRIVLEGY